jgi:hypothetical protein
MDRPFCSQCRVSVLACRYPEGGKRGIPAVYISSLERRLQETEEALYGALLALEATGSIGSATSTIPLQQTLSKVQKQEEWHRLPLKSSEQIIVWLREKQKRHPDDDLQSAQKHPPPRPDTIRRASSSAPPRHEQTPAAMPQQLPSELACTEEQREEPGGQLISDVDRLEPLNRWRNYF